MDKRPLHIGLISPYGGSNLGDQAVQAACIENLRSRKPNTEITGIYLNVWRPAKIHRIATFPLTGLAIPFYSNTQELFGRESRNAAEPNMAIQPLATSFSAKLRNVLKKFAVLRSLVEICRESSKNIANPFREVRWLGRSWRLLKRIDAIIVAGGGQFCDDWGGAWGHPYSLFRWAVICKLRGRKFIIMSVGVSTIKARLSRYLFSKATRLADYVSYRDPESALMALSILSSRTPQRIVYDLACTLPYIEEARSASTTSDMVAIAPIAYNRPDTWPQANAGVYRNYLQSLSDVVCDLVKRGLHVTLFTTSGNDRLATDELMNLLSATSAVTASAVRVIHPSTAEDLLDVLAPARLVIVSRLHGAILSHLIEKPVIAISPDLKVDSQMKQFLQEDLLLPIATVTTNDILVLVDRALAREFAIKEQLVASRIRLSGGVSVQYDTVLQHIEMSATPD